VKSLIIRRAPIWHARCKRLAPRMDKRFGFTRLVSRFLPRRAMPIPDRSVVRLALRLAHPEQRVLLVEMAVGYRVVPADAPAARRGDLEVFGALSRGALLLARERGLPLLGRPRP
jgi:hypothetical protein